MRRIGLLVVGFLVASTTVGRVDAANPNSSPAASTTAPGEPEDAKYALLTELILDAGGLGAYPDSDGTIVVVIPAARVSAFAIDSATRLGLRVRIEASPTTPERVAEIKERVREFAADHPRDTGEFGMFFDPQQGRVVVEGSASPDVFDEVLAAFSGEIVHRQADGGRSSRQADYPPFYGGSALGWQGTPLQCSSGFTVQAPSTYRYLLTAGHCFQYWDEVYSPGSGERIGRVGYVAPWPTRDMAKIGGELYSPRIYRGGANSSTYGAVRGAANFEMGYANYCRGGAVSGEKCGFHVVDLTATLCWGGPCTSNLAALVGGECDQPGDSGGPWFQPITNSQDVYIKGMHVGDQCSTQYAEKWPVIKTQLGVTIVTG